MNPITQLNIHDVCLARDDNKISLRVGRRNTDTSSSLYLAKYTPETVYSRDWNETTIMSRGIVIDENANIVARPFPKFFNYGEMPDHSFESISEVQEKVDGSLGVVFHDGAEWRVTTSGSFDSDQARQAQKMLGMYSSAEIDDMTNCNADPSLTYLVEIIYPENRIVVDYKGFSGFYILGALETKTGREIPIEDLVYPPKWRVPKRYPVSDLESFVEAAETLDANDEGYIVIGEPNQAAADFYGNILAGQRFRMKIKGKAYLEAHRLVSDMTPKRILEIFDPSLPDYGIESIRHRLASLDVPNEFVQPALNWAEIIKSDLLSMRKQVGLTCSKALREVRETAGLSERYKRKLFVRTVQDELDGYRSDLFGSCMAYYDCAAGKSNASYQFTAADNAQIRQSIYDAYCKNRFDSDKILQRAVR